MCGKIFAIIYLVTQGIPENGEVFLRIIHPLLTCFDKTAFQNFCDLFVLLIVRRRNKMIFQLNFQSLFSLYNDFIECFFAQQGGTDLLQRVVECCCKLIFFLELLEKTVPPIEKKPRDRDFFIGGSLLYEILPQRYGRRAVPESGSPGGILHRDHNIRQNPWQFPVPEDTAGPGLRPV